MSDRLAPPDASSLHTTAPAEDVELIEEAQELARMGLWSWEKAGNRLAWSKRVFAICGQSSAAQPDLKEFIESVHEADRPALVQALYDLVDGKAVSGEYRITGGDGRQRHIYHRGRPVLEAGEVIGARGFIQDVTEFRRAERALRRSQERFELAFRHSPLVKMLVSPAGRFIDVNERFVEVVGYERSEVLGRAAIELGLWNDAELEGLERVLAERQGCLRNHHIGLRTRAGELRQVALYSEYIDLDDDERCLFLQFEDITERKAQERRLQFLAHHDALTELPNRQLFHERCRDALARAQRQGLSVAVLYLDLDCFKQINDTYGHQAGDVLLKEAARRMSACVRATDVCARLGGDEFVILLDGLTQLEGVKRVAEQLIESIRQPVEAEGECLQVSTSIGIAVYPGHGETEKELIAKADEALYRAKSEGRNNYRVSG